MALEWALEQGSSLYNECIGVAGWILSNQTAIYIPRNNTTTFFVISYIFNRTEMSWTTPKQDQLYLCFENLREFFCVNLYQYFSFVFHFNFRLHLLIPHL